MGWETNVITQIVFNKETYDSIYKVEEEIDFCNRRIQEIGNKLMIYSTSRPEDILLNKKEGSSAMADDTLLLRLIFLLSAN